MYKPNQPTSSPGGRLIKKLGSSNKVILHTNEPSAPYGQLDIVWTIALS